MAKTTFEYDDGDDYGLPILRPIDKRTQWRIFYRRYRTTILICLAVLSLWWFRGAFKYPTKQWSRYAYVQYATDSHSMCNALMGFEALHRLGSKPDRVLLFPEEWNDQVPRKEDRNSELLYFAKKLYGVKVKPVQLLSVHGVASPGTMAHPSDWRTSITKLRAFELEEYDRVLHLDSDITLQAHMDELFSLPSTPIAMPRMYWEGDGHRLTSLIMLIEPNAAETRNMFERLQEWHQDHSHTPSDKYDVDLLNERFSSSAMVLPHRPYALLTSEFRKANHSMYMGSTNGPPTLPKWEATAAVKEAKLIHFSDWPLPKPWIMWPSEGVLELQPACGGPGHHGTCAEREVWKGLYDNFRRRRKELCRILSVPATTDWAAYKNASGYRSPDPPEA